MHFSNYDQQTRDLILESIWNHSLVGIAIVDRHGKFMKANLTFCKYVQYSEAELCSKTYMDITMPEDIEWDQEMCRRVMSLEEERFDMPKRYITKFHTVIKILLRAIGVVKENEFLFFVSQIAILEEEKQITSQALLNSQKRQFTFWSNVRKNWAIISFMITLALAAIGAIATAFISYHKQGGI